MTRASVVLRLQNTRLQRIGKIKGESDGRVVLSLPELPQTEF